jgi:uncharacterized protein (DUF2236 family)
MKVTWLFMPPFVAPSSIVRTIWASSDTILLIFAGAAAEFAANRAVDWLFFTGKLPNDPIGRFFTTVRYAQEIVFADEATAQQTFDRINSIHHAVEKRRGDTMPDWANRDVLYMLIDYSERAFRMVERPLTPVEQADLFEVFRRVGVGLGVRDLPTDYQAWQQDRQRHMERDLVCSPYTTKLYRRYREHLGWWRYNTLLDVQALLVPPHVQQVLGLRAPRIPGGVAVYRLLRRLGLCKHLQRLMIPAQHLPAVRQLDQIGFQTT